MSEARQQQHPQEPAEGGEEDVGAPGADQAGADRGTGGEAKPSRHPEEPAEGSGDDVEAPGAERAGNGGQPPRHIQAIAAATTAPETMMRTGKGWQVLTSVAALTLVGGFLADWNRTHLFNPNWPPHAQHHDTQTILFGSLLGVSELYFLRRRGKYPERGLALGALLSSLFWIAQGMTFAFPEAVGFQSKFPEKVSRIGTCGSTSGSPVP